MTTKDVASRFQALANEGKFQAIQDELFSQDAESIEPASGISIGMKNAQGLDAIREKGKLFNEQVEEMHGGYSSDPVVGGDYFSVAMGMDVTMKGAGRMNLDEIAVYEVKDGKIIKEQFFY